MNRRVSIPELISALRSNSNYVDLSTLQDLEVRLCYATEDNFMKRNVYGDFQTAFLHREAAEPLVQAARLVSKRRKGHRLVILDALRPHRFQFDLWDLVKGTPQQDYVADPALGSIHAYGLAVDLSVLDGTDQLLDMGTPFDGFTRLSEPRCEPEFLESGELTPHQMENRLLLRQAMTESGFLPIPNEWWHFNRFPSEHIRKAYPRIE